MPTPIRNGTSPISPTAQRRRPANRLSGSPETGLRRGKGRPSGRLRAGRVSPTSLLALPGMPIYEYRCPNGHVFELFQRMTDEPAETCPTCGEGPVERVLYPVAVHFKGSGFYTTDYGRGSKRGGSKDGSGGSESSGNDGGGGSESGDKPTEKKAAEA